MNENARGTGATGEEPTPTDIKPPVSPVLIALTISTGFFMDGMDSTIVVTSIPQMAASFGVAPLLLSLTVTSYLLSLALFIPISGWIADRFGARDVYCTAIVIFTGASALCGTAESLETMIAYRVLQGFGGALMTPVGRLIMVRAFPKDQLVRVMAFMAIPGLLGPTLGPLVGGFLTTYVSWRWIFYINIPIGILGIVMTIRLVENYRIDLPTKFDVPGFMLVGVGFAMLQLGLETIGRGLLPVALPPVMLVVSALCLVGYVLYARHRENPVLDLTLLRIRTFRMSMTAGLIARTGIGAAPFVLPLMFQLGFGLSAMESGLLTFASTVGSISIRFAIPVVLRVFGFRTFLIGVSLLVAAMIAGLALFNAGTPHWIIWSYLFVFGFVRSSAFTGIGTLGYADLTPEIASRGTTIASVVQQLAQSLGVAVSATLLALLAGGHGGVGIGDFQLTLVIVALLPALAAFSFRGLHPHDGMHVSHHQPRDLPR